MRILVTGSEGSLMQAMIPKLLAEGHQVIGVDKCGPHDERPPYEFQELDLVHLTRPNYFGPVDMVIHAAATIYGVGGFNAYCADIIGNDLVMTRNLLNYAVKNNLKKFVFLSSSMVYERCFNSDSVEEAMVDWDSFPVPYTDYGLSKYTGERMVKAFNRQYGLPYVIWRPFNIITPYEIAKGIPGYAHVFADFFNAILIQKKDKIPLISPGTQSRCFTWIDDVADAIATYSTKATGTYNIGATEEITMENLAMKIWMTSGRKLEHLGFDYLPCISGDVMRRKPNVDKIKIDLGWEPETSLDQSIRLCLKEYERKGYR